MFKKISTLFSSKRREDPSVPLSDGRDCVSQITSSIIEHHIFPHLSTSDLSNCTVVSKFFRNVVSSYREGLIYFAYGRQLALYERQNQIFWYGVYHNWESVWSKNSLEILDVIRSGISPTEEVRPLLWRKLIGKSQDDLLTYQTCSQGNPPDTTAIGNDVRRSGLISEDEQEKMRRILIAFCVHQNIGYWSGMNFVLVNILSVLPDEEEAFWAFEHILMSPKIRLCEIYSSLGLKKNMQQIEDLLPLFFTADDISKMKNASFPSSDVAISFSSLFSYNYTPKETRKIWDLILIEGWSAAIKIEIAKIYLMSKVVNWNDPDNAIMLLVKTPESIKYKDLLDVIKSTDWTDKIDDE